MKSCFLTELDAENIDDKKWKLLKKLVYQSALLHKIIDVPKDFITDFSSVPRVPIIFLFFGDRAHRESVIHDYLYRTVPHMCTRVQADRVFLEAMKVRGKNVFIRVSMYVGVRIGGSKSWR